MSGNAPRGCFKTSLAILNSGKSEKALLMMGCLFNKAFSHDATLIQVFLYPEALFFPSVKQKMGHFLLCFWPSKEMLKHHQI